MKVGIIGGGISGLTVAHHLQKMGIAYDVFEQADNPGGNIKTIRMKDYVLEMGPNALQMTEDLEILIRELKLDDEVIESRPVAENRYVLRHGQYQQLPGSPFSLLTNSFFPLKTKYRILQEPFLKKQPENLQETVAQFFERRFGREVLDYVVAPLVMGIYAGDPQQMLMLHTFPQFVKYEKENGSVLKGLLKNRPPHRRVFTFKNGLQTLTDAIASKLIDLHTTSPVEMITKTHGKFIVSTTSPDYVNYEFDVLVLALPAHKATPLLEFTYPGVSAAFRNVNYPPVCVVHTVYPRAEVHFPLEGYGALHPKIENQFTAGVVWSSSVFEGRCNPEEVLFTSIIGGTPSAANTQKPRLEILKMVHDELKRNYQISADKPIFQHFYLWSQAIPQFDLFIEDAHEQVKTLEQDHIFVASNWYSGVSVPDCIRQAAEVAKKIQELAATLTA